MRVSAHHVLVFSNAIYLLLLERLLLSQCSHLLQEENPDAVTMDAPTRPLAAERVEDGIKDVLVLEVAFLFASWRP